MRDLGRVLPQTARVAEADPRLGITASLEIGGCRIPELVREHGTPLFVLCEQTFRDNLRRYRDAFGAANVHYAAKAFLTRTIVPLLVEEGVGIDCASGGELYTALAGGMDPARLLLHGNNKSSQELSDALDAGVGLVVLDSAEELIELDRLAGLKQSTARVLLRVTPGIEAHTHDFLKTGIEDTKFGVPIGVLALDVVRKAEAATNVELVGLHSHIGSQIFDTEPFAEAARVMVRFLAECRRATGLGLPELDLGGGLGIAYEPSDDPATVEELGKVVLEAVGEAARAASTAVPEVKVEPGRSIVGPATITVYTSGVVKDVPGVRRYVSVDGGMSDNIRPMLYGARYTFLSATRPDAQHDFEYAVSGKLCENGDVLTREARLPPIEAGELIAVAATGAYCYALSSNYNKQPRPAVVSVADGTVRLLARRESYEDLVRLEA